jgi:hypothetical protein
MNKLILFLSVVTSQKLIWTSNVTFNEYQYLPWDYHNGILLFYSNGIEYKCVSLNCSVLKPENTPTTYLITNEYVFVNYHLIRRTCRLLNNRTSCVILPNYRYIDEFQSISTNGGFFYFRIPETSEIEIYDINIWDGEKLSSLKKIKNFHTLFHVKKTGIYGAKVGTDVSILKYPPDGSGLVWSNEFPYCRTEDPTNDLIFAYEESKVFVICRSVNLITVYGSSDGTIINQYPIDNSSAVAMECSSRFLFILYGEGSVAQYTLDFNYVHTYRVNNMKAPRYNMLRVDDDYLLYVLCENKPGHEGCFIYKWAVYFSETNKFLINYVYAKSDEISTLSVENSTSLIISREFLLSQYLKNYIRDQNSYFSPVTYRDQRKYQHLLFFLELETFKKAPVVISLFMILSFRSFCHKNQVLSVIPNFCSPVMPIIL